MVQGVLTSVVTVPIAAQYFGRLSYVAPATNLLAIPWATLLATPATLLWALTRVLRLPRWLHAPLAYLADTSLCALDAGAVWASRWTWAAGNVAPWPPVAALALWGSMAAALYAWRWRAQSQWLRPSPARLCRCLTVGLALLVATWLVTGCGAGTRRHEAARPLRIWQLDVGQGDATLVGLPEGQWALFDGGGATYPRAPDPAATWWRRRCARLASSVWTCWC